MHGQILSGKTVAILATDGFEQAELEQPRAALIEAGAKTRVVAPGGGTKGAILGFEHREPGRPVHVDVALEDAEPEDYDALMLPGGIMNPDALHTNPEAVSFVQAFFEAGKPVADQGLVASRRPDDIPRFTAKMIETFAETPLPARR